MKVRCVISCRDASGVPTFAACQVVCDQTEYDEGEHYEMAKAWAEEQRYESVGLVYDQNDGPGWLFEQFDWQKAGTISRTKF